jgi:hypothetical protein
MSCDSVAPDLVKLWRKILHGGHKHALFYASLTMTPEFLAEIAACDGSATECRRISEASTAFVLDLPTEVAAEVVARNVAARAAAENIQRTP